MKIHVCPLKEELQKCSQVQCARCHGARCRQQLPAALLNIAHPKRFRSVLKQTGAFSPGPWNDDMKDITGVYMKPGGCFVIVEDCNVLIGIGGLKINSNEEAEIKRMRVDPIRQRCGVGQRILDHLVAFAKSRNIRRLILDTTELQQAAQRFYLKNGFVEYGRSHWNGLQVILFEKQLNRGIE